MYVPFVESDCQAVRTHWEEVANIQSEEEISWSLVMILTHVKISTCTTIPALNFVLSDS